MSRWLPIIRPPWWLIAMPAVVLVGSQIVLSVTRACVWWSFGVFPEDDAFAQPLVPQTTRAMCCILFAMLYGAFRATAFHPVFRPDYRAWLANTPWSSRLQLPLGPIHWVWQDVLFIAPAILIPFGPDNRFMLAVPIMFVLAYTLFITIGLFLTGERWIGFAILFVGGLALHVTVEAVILDAGWWPILTVALVSYPLLWWGLRRSLRRFAMWDLSWLDQQFGLNANRDESIRRQTANQLGWPFDAIAPQRKRRATDAAGGIAISLLNGWWLYASHINDVEGVSVLLGVLMAPCGMSVVYWVFCRPPISLWGRLRTGRLILPRYDRLFLWPLFTCAVQLAWLRIAFQLGLSLPILSAIQVTIFTWCMFRAMAAFQAFQLTGAHRIPRPLGVGSKSSTLFTTA